MVDNEIKFYKAEYEQLRRKKRREINQLEIKIAKHIHIFYDYLQFKGLVEDFTRWKEIYDRRT